MGVLGWSSQQFWTATLPETLAGYRGYQIREDRRDLRVGMLMASIYEQNRNPEKKLSPFTPYDFFPHLRPLGAIDFDDESDPLRDALKYGDEEAD